MNTDTTGIAGRTPQGGSARPPRRASHAAGVARPGRSPDATASSRRAGYILIDSLVALGLVTGAVFMAAHFYRSLAFEQRRTEEYYAAQLLAESEIERLHALSYDAIPVGAAQPLKLNLPSAASLKEAKGELSVAQAAPGLKRATVRIQWTWRDGRALHVELSSAFAQAGRGEGEP